MVEEHKKQELKRKKVMYTRLHVLWLAIFLLFAVLILRLSVVQLVDGEEYLKKAEENNIKKIPTVAPRGIIYDRKGKELVTNEPIFTAMYIETNHSDDVKIEMAKNLAELLDMEAADVLEAMDVGVNLDGQKVEPKQPRYTLKKIKAGLTEEQVAKIRERPEKFPGVNVVYEPKRLYRDDTFAVQTIGYVRSFSGSQQLDKYKEIEEKNPDEYLDWEQVGNDGIEYAYQDELRGKHGSKLVRVDAQGRIVEELENENPEIGHSLYLNLDETIQLEGEKFVESHLRKLRSWEMGRYRAPHAKNAYAVMMEVDTGKVRAMISYPDYDPNVWQGKISEKFLEEEIKYVGKNGTITSVPPDVRGSSNPDVEINRHPWSILPMGSTYKPLNILMMLNEGIIGPYTGFNDRGAYHYARSTNPVRNDNSHAYGYLNPRTALMKSSNVYMAWTGHQFYRRTGGEDGDALDILSKYNQQFGLFTSTGVDLPGESKGNEDYIDMVENGSNSVLGATVLASFGQAQRPTALQLAQFAATIANDGVRMQPQLVDKIVDSEGNVVQEIEPKVMSKADDIKQEYFDVVQDGMKLVTSSGGTARSLFHNLPHKVAAKTGTSEQDIPIYDGDRFVRLKRVENSVMVAYYPADDPKVAVAAVVPEGGYGSRGAGPIVEKLLELYQREFMDKKESV
jgi:penicillin-binding protein 2